MSVLTVSLGPLNKVRVWLEELPDAKYQAGKTLEVMQVAKASMHPAPICAAVELKRVLGPRTLCGLLGATFLPEESERCVIQVAVGSAFEIPSNWRFPEFSRKETSWALAARVDSIYVGLPEEYAPAVLNGAVRAGALLGSGLVRFDCATHGLIGSSQRVFQDLARLVVEILSYEPTGLSEEQLHSIVAAAFVGAKDLPDSRVRRE
jgi:hypothetical protein